jgi:hypothetical protein
MHDVMPKSDRKRVKNTKLDANWNAVVTGVCGVRQEMSGGELYLSTSLMIKILSIGHMKENGE